MNCLVIDDMHPSMFSLFEPLGLCIDYKPEITRLEILQIIANYQVLIVRSKTPVDKELLQAAPKLKIIGRAGSGRDNIDLAYATQHNIKVVHAAEGNRQAVGEHALGLLLNLLNHINRSHQQVSNFVWAREQNRGTQLNTLTVGIYGFGNTGSAFANCLKGIGCTVLAYDKYKLNPNDQSVHWVNEQQLFEQADVLSLHVPLTPITENLVNQTFFNHFRKNIYLLNTARGGIVNLPDLVVAINSGKVIAAGLDVLENEKFENLTVAQKQTLTKLVKTDKVLLTPHVAGWTFRSYEHINEVLADKIKKCILE